MDYLLDTHILLWFINGEELDWDLINKIFLSIASLWEIAIKHSLGKLPLQSEFSELKEILHDTNIEILPIEFSHLQELLVLPDIHNDPFDRIIIAQAIHENLKLITRDSKFKGYAADITWV
jgi:PIN domain nuclease of toxin-antitoxin system